MIHVEPLLFVPSPRDLTEFYDEFNKITNYDKYFVRYHKPEIEAYDMGRSIFLEKENERYTHFIVCADDLLIKQEHIDKLFSDLCYLEMIGESQNVCIGGYCNVDTTTNSHLSNITFDKVQPERQGRTYNFATLQQMRDLYSTKRNTPYPFIEVSFSGFPLFAIPRKILERIEFRNDSTTGKDLGCCLDVMWCYDTYMNNYKVLCDLSLELYHMKISDSKFRNYMANILESKMYFEYKKYK